MFFAGRHDKLLSAVHHRHRLKRAPISSSWLSLAGCGGASQKVLVLAEVDIGGPHHVFFRRAARKFQNERGPK
jgi:hypothetical protein